MSKAEKMAVTLTSVTLTFNNIVQVISALEEVGRVLHLLDKNHITSEDNIITSEDITRLQKESADALQTVAEAQHTQLWKS